LSNILPHSLRLLALIEKLSGALELEDAQLLAEAAQTAQRLESGEGFNAKAIVSLRDNRPYLDCSWMGMLAQITPEQARSMGLGLIQTAAEAESDAAMLKFFRETGISDEKAVAAVAIVRDERSKFQEVVGEKQEPGAGLGSVVPFGSKPS
jgi:hypothetical protein